MKPYLKALHNKIRFLKIKIFSKATLKTNGIQLFDYHSRFVFKKGSRVTFGDRVICDGRCLVIVDENAELKIGDRVYFNEGLMLSSKESIIIGSNCIFGPNVLIFDNNHRFNKNGVQPGHTAKSVTIGNNCWIASNVTILKGAHIGNNCVIGAGCVVKGNIPSGSLVKNTSGIEIVPIEDR